MRKFNRELIKLLKKGGSYSEEEILANLNIDPSDSEHKAVGRQLEILEEYGIVEYTGRGWRWKG